MNRLNLSAQRPDVKAAVAAFGLIGASVPLKDFVRDAIQAAKEINCGMLVPLVRAIYESNNPELRDDYYAVLDDLHAEGVVEHDNVNHVLRWTGPTEPQAPQLLN